MIAAVIKFLEERRLVRADFIEDLPFHIGIIIMGYYACIKNWDTNSIPGYQWSIPILLHLHLPNRFPIFEKQSPRAPAIAGFFVIIIVFYSNFAKRSISLIVRAVFTG